MERVMRGLVSVVVVSALAVIGAPVGASASPNPSATINALNGVEAISPTDAWAVGWYEHNRTGVWNSLAMRWDGVRWTRFWTPNGSGPGAQLQSVSAVASDDVWAVGVFHRKVSGERDLPLALHWDGASWTRVWTPRPIEGATLEDVVAIAADDVWAVGATRTIPSRTLTMHWNGVRWSRVWSPSSPSGERSWLHGVGATATDDVWAVGGAWGTPSSLALHWNGVRWARVDATVVKANGRLEAIAPRTQGDAWAVGGYGFLRWDGADWSPVGPEANLYGVDVVPDGHAWAVGQQEIFAWDGVTWTNVWSERARPLGFNDVSALGTSDVWAVGFEHTYIGEVRRTKTLIMRWDGDAWSRW